MKMKTPIASPCDGTVAEIRVTAGGRVNAGSVLMVIEESK
jgi:biotin carboxyl carrier protein